MPPAPFLFTNPIRPAGSEAQLLVRVTAAPFSQKDMTAYWNQLSHLIAMGGHVSRAGGLSPSPHPGCHLIAFPKPLVVGID